MLWKFRRLLRIIRIRFIKSKHRYRFMLSSFYLWKSGNIICSYKDLTLYQPLYVFKFGGKYIFGKNVQFGYDIGGRYKHGYCELQSRIKGSYISIGDYTAINNNFTAICCGRIEIGDHCRIGANCQIMDFDAHGIDPGKRNQIGEIADVVIGKNVWIGNNTIILPGVHIGDNSIIGAGAVVTKSVPDNVVFAGVPAKFVKKIDHEEI